MYDRYGMEGISGGHGGGPGMDPADVFAQFFGGMNFGFDYGPGGFGMRKKGEEKISIDVTLEDLYNGKSVKMSLEREVVCGVCNG